jgi:serine/threonine protein phosphatase PrpC
MKTAAKWRAGSASDPGLVRTINEDRVWFDETRGIFLVVDGLGGHAAGEIAAAAAVDVVRQNLDPSAADLDLHIRAVICAANNEIYRLAEENPTWRGMACVLTLAVLRDEQAVIGHVGDSRLYLFWNGKLKKITSDHSPVGEQEDQGLISEEEAMHHPRRNEVFRDVGSEPRLSNDSQFIEIRSFLFREDAALMLCSDGLTDLVPAAEITHIIEQFDGDSTRIAQLLIEAANTAGGRDNISVVFVAGPEFAGADSPRSYDARQRHATTRARSDAGTKGRPRWVRYALLTLLAGAIGFAAWRIIVRVTTVPPVPAPVVQVPAATFKTVEVNAADARGIIDALNVAEAGETISVPPGEFLGPLILKEGVDIIAKEPQKTVVRSDPASTTEPGIAIVSRGVQKASISGMRIEADDTHPLKIGVLIVDSSIQLVNMDVSGAVYSGIRMEGVSSPRVEGCFIHSNGLMVNSPRPGIEVGANSKPVLEDNLISGNGTDEPMKPVNSEHKEHQEEKR